MSERKFLYVKKKVVHFKNEIMKKKITSFIHRLKKIGIEIELVGNYPWIYLDKINGKKVSEKFLGNHGFVIGFTPLRPNQEFEFTDIKEIFIILRKYK